MRRLLLTQVFIAFIVSLTHAQSPSWEAHLNLRGITTLLNGEAGGSILLKTKLSNQTYARLGLSGYHLTNKQTGSLGNNILIRRFVVGFRPGLEKRTALTNKLFLLRGIDLVCELSGYDNFPPNIYDYSLSNRANSIGLSPFIGLHYQVNSYIGVLVETHLDAFAQFITEEIRNDTSSPYSNRVQKRTDTLIQFQPFQYITVCLSF